MARPPSFSVEEFQALISMTLDLNLRDHNRMSGEVQGHSRISSPNLLNEEFPRMCEGEEDGRDDTTRVELGHSDSERMRRWTGCRTPQSERRMSRVGCECDCGCGCGYVGKWLGSSGRCERCERKCRVAAIDTENDEKRGLGLGTPAGLPSSPHPRKRRFSLSTSLASPSPAASHAASTGLLSKVTRAIRRISISSPNTPVSQKTQEKTPHTTPWKRSHRRSLSTAFSTHSPTLTPTKEERLKIELEKKEEEGREGILFEDSKRSKTEEVESETKSDSKSRQNRHQSHSQYHLSHSHSQHQHQHPHHYQHPYYKQHQYPQRKDSDIIDSPSSWTSFEFDSNRDSEYSPTTPTEPATPITFDSEPRVNIRTHAQKNWESINLDLDSNMLAIAPVGTQGLLTPSVEDVVGCMGSSSGDESGGERARSRERQKSREREREMKERERQREKEKEKERKDKKEKEKEKKRSLKLNPDSSISKASAGMTSTPTATPTKLQFPFPLGMFGPSTSGADSSTAPESPGTPSSMTFGSLVATGHVSGGGSESEDQRGRKLSMLGRLRKGLNMTSRSKTMMSSPSTLSPSSPVGYTIRGVNVGGDVDTNGIRRDSVLAREREELERDVDLRFVNSPSPFPSLGHGEGEECAREGCQSQCQHQHGEGNEESEESASLSVEVARRGVGEGGLPSVCVTFATSSASGSGSSGVCEDEEGSQSGSGSCNGSGSSGSASGRGSGSKKRRRRKRRGGTGSAGGSVDVMSVNVPQIGMRDLSSTNVSTIPSMYSMPSYVSAASTMQASTNTKTRISMQASVKTLNPRASMRTISVPSDYSCESYMGSESSFFAADVIERERERREDSNSNSTSRKSRGAAGRGGAGGYLSTSSGGNSKKSTDSSFLSLDLSGSEGSGSDDTSRGVGVKRGKKGVDGGSFIEFGEDRDSDGNDHGRHEGEGGKERRKRVMGMSSTPPRLDHRGKKRASVVLFRGSGSASSVKTNANGDLSSPPSAPSSSPVNRAHPSPNNNSATSYRTPDGGSFKVPSIASRSDISIFSGSTHFEFAPVDESTGGSGGHAQSKLNGKGKANGNGKPTRSGSGSGYHASDSLAFPSSHHHSNRRRGMEPSIRVFDVDGDSLLKSSSSIGHGGGADAISLSARSVDALSVDGMSVNSDDTDYIPFLPLVLQHERLQQTLRRPVSMEAVVSANEAGRGVTRSVRSVASMASMCSMASGSVRSGEGRNSADERDRQRRSSAVRLDPRSAHTIASKAKAAARLGISPSEVSLAAGSGSDSSKKRLSAHVSASTAGVCIPVSSNVSRAPSICSSVGTEESVVVRGGPRNRSSGMSLWVNTNLDLDLGARRVVVCGSGLDAGVEDLRETRMSISSEDGAGSVVISEDAQSQRGTIVDGDEDALEVTPTPTPRTTAFAVNTLEVIPSVTSTPSISSSKKTFIGLQQALSPQSSIGSIRRTPSRQALKATPPRAPPSDPLPLPPLSPSATSSSSSDNRALLSSNVSGSVTVSSRLTSDVNSVSSGTSVSVVAGEREVGASSPKAEKKVEEGKKGRIRLSMQNPKDLWRARKKASAVSVGPEPRCDATSSANLDMPTPLTPAAVLPAGNTKVGVVFPTSRSLSFSSPSSQNLREKQRGKKEIDKGDVVHQDQDRDIDDGDQDCASISREKEGSSRSTPSSTQSDDEERASGDDNDDESIDLDSDSMRQLLAANTSANAAIHSNLDVYKIGMGRQVIVPSPPKKKKSANRLNESERLRARSSLGLGMEWTLGLGETKLKDEVTIPARHASHSSLLKKASKPEPEPEVTRKRSSRLSNTPSTSSRARTKSESALRALDSDSARSKKNRPVLPDFNDWTLSLPLPSPRDFERSRKVSELGASIGLASVVGEKSKERQQTSHRHSTAPTASKRHTLDQKKRRASHHPIVRADDVDSGVDLEATRGDDEPSESDEDDLRTPPLNTHVAQAFVVPRVVSVADSLGMGDSVRAKRAEVDVLGVQAETDMAEEQLEEDTHATRIKSNLAKLDALSADLKHFNELLRSGHPGSGSRKSEASLRSVSSQKGLMKGSTPPESHPNPGPFSYSMKLKHARSCEPFESNEPAEDTQLPPKNALFRTSCASLRESVLLSLPVSDNELGNEKELEGKGDMSDLSISTLRQRKTSQSSMKRRSQPRISLSKSRSSLTPVIQSPSAAEEDINCSTIDIMDVESQSTGFTANAVFGPTKWGKSSSLGRSALPGQSRTYARAPLPFAPPVESTIAASSTAPPQNITNERRPKKLSDGIADISPTLRNAVSSIELGRMVPIPTAASKKSAVHVGEQRETAKLAPPQAPSSKKLAVPPNLSVQIAPMRRSSIILSEMTPTSTTSSTFPTPLASSFPIPPNTLPSLPLDFELGAKRMAQIVPPTPPAPVQDSSRSIKSQKRRPSTSSSTSTVTESVVQQMKERLESLGKNASKSATPVPTSPVESGEPEDTDQSSLCSGVYYSARSSFSE